MILFLLCWSTRRISSSEKLFLLYCDDFCSGINFANTTSLSYTDTDCRQPSNSLSESYINLAQELCPINSSIATAIPPQTAYPAQTAYTPIPPQTAYPVQTAYTPIPPQTLPPMPTREIVEETNETSQTKENNSLMYSLIGGSWIMIIIELVITVLFKLRRTKRTTRVIEQQEPTVIQIPRTNIPDMTMTINSNSNSSSFHISDTYFEELEEN